MLLFLFIIKTDEHSDIVITWISVLSLTLLEVFESSKPGESVFHDSCLLLEQGYDEYMSKLVSNLLCPKRYRKAVCSTFC